MRRRQRVPRQWAIVTDAAELGAIRRLPNGTAILLIGSLSAGPMRRLRRAGVPFVEERHREAARVHNVRELRRALLARTPLILLSPMFPTSTHPEWKPIPPMRAAALARLGGRKLVALGGMDARKFARIKPLGFHGWAGISAFRT